MCALAERLELLDESDKVVLDLTRTTVTSDGATAQPAQKVPLHCHLVVDIELTTSLSYQLTFIVDI